MIRVADRNRVETYLAVKYGVTIGGHNYLSTSSATVYDFSTYGNAVARIGREDAEGLHQKQSKSASPTNRKRLTRQWKLQETGTVGSVLVRIPASTSTLASKLPAESNLVYLLTDAEKRASHSTETPSFFTCTV